MDDAPWNTTVSNNCTNGDMLLPSHQPSDYIVISLSGILTLLGLPINFVAIWHLLGDYIRGLEQNKFSNRVILCLNLVVANIFVLTFACLGKLIWHSTYQWYGGDVFCKLFHFGLVLGAYLTSNITVAISVEMLITFCRPFSGRVRRYHIYIPASWVAAIICAAPQLRFYKIVAPFKCHPGWQQCHSLARDDSGVLTTEGQRYNILHLCLVFWLPLAIMAPAYGIIIYLIVEQARGHKILTHRPKSYDGSMNSSNSASFMLPQKPAIIKRLNSDVVKHRFIKGFKLAYKVLGLYIICWLPYQTISLWELIDYNTYLQNESYLDWFSFIYLAYSCINPLVYSCDTRPDDNPSRFRGSDQCDSRWTPFRSSSRDQQLGTVTSNSQRRRAMSAYTLRQSTDLSLTAQRFGGARASQELIL